MRSGKGRLKTSEKTVSIKIRLPKSTADQLKGLAIQHGVPMASIVRQGINNVLVELTKENK